MKLICGDCRTELKKIDTSNCIIVTDPPFNIGYHYNEYKDKMKEKDYYAMLCEIAHASEACVFIHYPEALYRLAIALGKAPEKVVSWVYNSNTRKQHRDIAFFGIKPDFTQVRQPYKNPKDKRVAKLIASGSGGDSVRLVEHKPNEKCKRREDGASVPNAIRGNEKHCWHTSKRSNYH